MCQPVQATSEQCLSVFRQAKLRKSVNDFVQSGLQHAKLDHLELIELNAVRPLLNHTIDHVARIETGARGARGGE